MQEENWKHQWLQPCLARHVRKTSMERPVPRLMISSLNLNVSWKPLNPQECVWKNLCQNVIAGKGDDSQKHYNLAHKLMPMLQAMKIPAAKAAVDKEWEKLEKISAWNLTEVKSKKDVIDEARTAGATVHFASLMDICHLKNAELEAKHQKYKGRVVLRGDIVKDDSGSYAVFAEQGSLESQMTAPKNHGYHLQIAKVRRTSSRRSIGLHPGKDGRCSKIVQQFQHRNVQPLGFVYHDTNGQNHGPVWKTQSFLLNEICMVILWQDCYGKGNSRNFYWNTVGKKFPIRNAHRTPWKRVILICVCRRYQTDWQETKY